MRNINQVEPDPFDMNQVETRGSANPHQNSMKWEDVAPHIGGTLSFFGKAKQAISRTWQGVVRFFKGMFGKPEAPARPKEKPSSPRADSGTDWTKHDWAPPSTPEQVKLANQIGINVVPVATPGADASRAILYAAAKQRKQEDAEAEAKAATAPIARSSIPSSTPPNPLSPTQLAEVASNDSSAPTSPVDEDAEFNALFSTFVEREKGKQSQSPRTGSTNASGGLAFIPWDGKDD